MALENKVETLDRKTSGVQRRGRAARVVNSILRATSEELTRVGYGALRIEEVAKRANVNKTTIYRRWSTKAELVSETIRNCVGTMPSPVTGSLRSDLFAYFARLVERNNDPLWRGILVTLNSHLDPELETLAKDLRQAARQRRTAIIQAGIDRGELPKSVDAELVGEIVSAPLLYRVLHLGENVDIDYITSVVDVVLAGAAVNALRVPQSNQ